MSLSLEKVTYAFNKKKKNEKSVISNLSFSVGKGEFVSIIGKSGTGKSTILKLIAGLLPADSGRILVNGETISLGSTGYMPQRDLLLPWRTVLENIMLSSEIQDQSKVTKEIAKTWLMKIGLSDNEKDYPQQLSGGMRQRVAFLRTILTGKEILLLDEPFGALDALTKKEMHKWLLSLWQELDKTILFITHDLEEAILLSDKIILLHPDQTVEEISINLPRPRNSEMVLTLEMLEYRAKLEKMISNG